MPRFVLLAKAVIFFLKDVITERENYIPENLLLTFVQQTTTLNRECKMTLNAHQLLQLSDAMHTFGPLWGVSLERSQRADVLPGAPDSARDATASARERRDRVPRSAPRVPGLSYPFESCQGE